MSNYLYLSGPITGLSYDKATDWREEVNMSVPDFIRTLSPLRGTDHLKSEKSIATSYENYPISSKKGITTTNYSDVKRSAAILVNFLGATKVSIGTVMELPGHILTVYL